ncbi:MAG: hypothetical protein FE78DRAFT_69073 [Acidomyces sp. 'richmondensis']|nr:MAG: hypothetical protein FE78DRAFT_69073 [Acidomyces sp. 'richmondensis']
MSARENLWRFMSHQYRKTASAILVWPSIINKLKPTPAFRPTAVRNHFLVTNIQIAMKVYTIVASLFAAVSMLPAGLASPVAKPAEVRKTELRAVVRDNESIDVVSKIKQRSDANAADAEVPIVLYVVAGRYDD